MQIVIDISRSGDGRLAGTARPASSAGEGRHFAGVMELIACLEQLCVTASQSDTPPGPGPRSGPQAPLAPPASAASGQSPSAASGQSPSAAPEQSGTGGGHHG